MYIYIHRINWILKHAHSHFFLGFFFSSLLPFSSLTEVIFLFSCFLFVCLFSPFPSFWYCKNSKCYLGSVIFVCFVVGNNILYTYINHHTPPYPTLHTSKREILKRQRKKEERKKNVILQQIQKQKKTGQQQQQSWRQQQRKQRCR